MDDTTLSLGVVLALVFIAIIILVVFFQFIPFGLWLTALFSGIRISFFTLFGMRFRRVDPRAIVIPMMSPCGCIGVLAIELATGREQNETVRSLGTILSAQLAVLLGAAPLAEAASA